MFHVTFAKRPPTLIATDNMKHTSMGYLRLNISSTIILN